MDSKKFIAVLKRMEPLFQQTHKMYSVGIKKTSLEMGDDASAYTDGTKVHIGLDINGPLGMLMGKSEKDQFTDEDVEQGVDIINYLIGHECGHVRYTDDEQYIWGIRSSALQIISYGYEYIEGKKKTFIEKEEAVNWLHSLNEGAQYVTAHQGELNALKDFIAKKNTEDAQNLVNTLLKNTSIPILIRSNLIDVRMMLQTKKFKNATIYVESILRKNKFYSYKQFEKLTAWLENALEDGRMEGAVAAKYEIFKNQRRQYRIIFRDHDGSYPSMQELEDPHVLIQEIMDAILSLATTQMYKKGFSLYYHSVPANDKAAADNYISTIESLHKDIYDAYIGSETMACSKANVNICKKLSPIIWKAFGSEKKETIPDSIKKMLEKLIKAAIESDINNLNAGAKKTPADAIRDSAFPFSDLTVTLDDETYDKLMDKMKKEGQSDNDGNGINIKREHPLPQKEEDEHKEQKSDSDECQSNSNSGNDDTGSDIPDSSIHDDNPSSNTTEYPDNADAYDDDSDEFPSGDQGQSSDGNGNPSESDSKSDTDIEETASSGQESSGDDKSQGSGTMEAENTSDSTGSHTKDAVKMSKEDKAKAKNDVEEKIQQEIEDAKKAAKENLKDQIELAKAAAEAEYNRRSRIQEQEPQSNTITKEEVKKICDCDFIEIPRKFPVDKKLRPDLQSRGNVARRNMEKILIPKKDRDLTHMTSGGLDIKRLSSLGMGKIDVFKKQQKGKLFSGCVYILKDNSGSMCGDKNRYACESMAVLEETYKGLLPLKIAAFSDTEYITHHVIKDWNEIRKDNCSWNFLQYTRPTGGNSDGYDIQIASYELLKRPEKNKLLIVLSDGMPSESTPGYTKGAIDEARKNGVKVCGIYFENGNIKKSSTAAQFKQMYEKDYICCNANEIDKNLLKIMRKFCR